MKSFINKLFYGINMTWKKVIFLSIICAVFSALFLVIPFTVGTSLSAPGTTFEFWIFITLIIVMNCKKPVEAGLKTFVFFLISQPLIYLLQVPFSHLGWQLFMFYPRWFVLTLLTFPGAIIAWYVKKDKIYSALILSVATAILVFNGSYYVPYVINKFPFYTLALVFCIGQAFFLNFALLKNKRNRIICFIITLAVLIFSLIRII